MWLAGAERFTGFDDQIMAMYVHLTGVNYILPLTTTFLFTDHFMRRAAGSEAEIGSGVLGSLIFRRQPRFLADRPATLEAALEHA